MIERHEVLEREEAIGISPLHGKKIMNDTGGAAAAASYHEISLINQTQRERVGPMPTFRESAT